MILFLFNLKEPHLHPHCKWLVAFLSQRRDCVTELLVDFLPLYSPDEMKGPPTPYQSQPKILYPAKLPFMDEKDILRQRGASNMPTIGFLKRYIVNRTLSGRKKWWDVEHQGGGRAERINIWAHIISFSLVYKRLFNWKQKFHLKWLLMPIKAT